MGSYMAQYRIHFKVKNAKCIHKNAIVNYAFKRFKISVILYEKLR